MQYKLIAHALIENDKGEALILKRNLTSHGKTNFEGGKWDIPGGTVEDGETPSQAAIREVKEEANIEVKLDRIVFEKSNYDENKEIMFTTLIYKCYVNDNFNIKLNLDEHNEYKWASYDEIVKMDDNMLVSYMKELFGKYV